MFVSSSTSILILSIVFYSITIIISLASSSTVAQNLYTWPNDFTVDSSLVQNIHDKDSTFEIDTWSLAPNENLIIRNCSFREITISTRQETSQNLFHLNGTSQFIIEDCAIGSVDLVGRNRVYNEFGMFQLNDQSKIIIRNCVFDPSFGGSPDPVIDHSFRLFFLTLKFNSEDASLFIEKNQFYSAGVDFQRERVFQLEIAAPPFTSSAYYTPIDGYIDKEDILPSQLNPTRFNELHVVDNYFYVEIAEKFMICDIRFAQYLLMNSGGDTSRYHQGNLINISNNKFEAPVVQEVAPNSNSGEQANMIRLYFGKNELGHSYYSEQRNQERYLLDRIIVDGNNFTTESTSMAVLVGFRVDTRSSLIMTTSSSFYSVSNNYFKKNSSFIIDRLEKYTRNTTTQNGVVTLQIDNIEVFGVWTGWFFQPFSSLPSIPVTPDGFSTQHTGKITISNNYVEAATNFFKAIYCQIHNTSHLAGVHLNDNTVLSSLFSSARAIEVVYNLVVRDIHTVEMSRNYIRIFNSIAARVNQSNGGVSEGYPEVQYLNNIVCIRFSSTLKVSSTGVSAEFVEKINVFLFNDNIGILNSRADAFGIELRAVLKRIKNTIANNNNISIYSYAMAISKNVDAGQSNQEEGDVGGAITEKQNIAIRVSPLLEDIGTMLFFNNTIFCNSILTGTSGGIMIQSGSNPMKNIRHARFFRNKMHIERTRNDTSEVAVGAIFITASDGLIQDFGVFEVIENQIEIIAYDGCPSQSCSGIGVTSMINERDAWSFNFINVSNNNITILNFGGYSAFGMGFTTMNRDRNETIVQLPYIILGKANMSIQYFLFDSNNVRIAAKGHSGGIIITTSGDMVMRSAVVQNNSVNFDALSISSFFLIGAACPGGEVPLGKLTLQLGCRIGGPRLIMLEDPASNEFANWWSGLPKKELSEIISSSITSSSSSSSATTYYSDLMIPGRLFADRNKMSRFALVVGLGVSVQIDTIAVQNMAFEFGDPREIVDHQTNAVNREKARFTVILFWGRESVGQSVIWKAIEVQNISIFTSPSKFHYCDDRLPFLPTTNAGVSLDNVSILDATLYNELNYGQFDLIVRNVSVHVKCKVPSIMYPTMNEAATKSAVTLFAVKYPPRYTLLENVNVKVEYAASTDDTSNNNNIINFDLPVYLFSFYGLLPSSSSSLSSRPTMVNISNTNIFSPQSQQQQPSSSTQSPRSSAILEDPVRFYSASQQNGNSPSSMSTAVNADCFNWNDAAVTLRSQLMKASRFDEQKSVFGCKGVFAVSRTMTDSEIQTQTRAFENTTTQDSTPSQSDTIRQVFEIEPISSSLIRASSLITSASAIVSPQILLSGVSGLALLQLSHCAVNFNFNDAFSESDSLFNEKLKNYSKSFLEKEVEFPQTFLPGLKIDGSYYKGAVLSHFIVFGLAVIVVWFIAQHFKSSWKNYILASKIFTNKSKRQQQTECAKLDNISAAQFCPFDMVILRVMAFVLSFGAPISGSMIGSADVVASNIAMAVILQLVIGISIAMIAGYLYLLLRGKLRGRNNDDKKKNNNKKKNRHDENNNNNSIENEEDNFDTMLNEMLDGPENNNSNSNSSSSSSRRNGETGILYHTEASELYFKPDPIDLEAQSKSKNKNNKSSSFSTNKRRSTAAPTSRTDHLMHQLRRFLQSPVGRFCFIGDTVWFNKYASVKDSTVRFGPGIQTQYSFMFKKTIGPLKMDKNAQLNDDDDDSFGNNPSSLNNLVSNLMEQHDGRVGNSSSNNNRRRAQNRHSSSRSRNNSDNSRARSRPSSSSSTLVAEYDNSFRRRLAPFYLYISLFSTMIVLLNLGAGQVSPNTCHTRFFVALIFCVISCLLSVYTRPSIIPMRNVLTLIIDIAIIIGGFILCGALLGMNAERTEDNISSLRSQLETAQIFLSLPALIFGSTMTGLQGLRFIVIRLTKTMIVPRTEVRLHLRRELEIHDEELKSKFFAPAAAATTTTTVAPTMTSSSGDSTEETTSTPNRKKNQNNNRRDDSLLLRPIRSQTKEQQQRHKSSNGRTRSSTLVESSPRNNRNNSHPPPRRRTSKTMYVSPSSPSNFAYSSSHHHSPQSRNEKAAKRKVNEKMKMDPIL